MSASEPGVLYAAASAIDRIAQAHRAAAAAALRELGVSESTAGLLWLLGDDAGCTMGEAAERLSCDRSNVTLLAVQLEKRGFVERMADPVDARRRNLRLTPDGQQAAARLRVAIAAGSPLRHLNAAAASELVSVLQASLASSAPDELGGQSMESSPIASQPDPST